MKLNDWFIKEYLASKDWSAAANSACDALGLPRYAPGDPALKSIHVTEKFYKSVPEQIRIISEGTAYTWMAGKIIITSWESLGEDRIRIWTDFVKQS